MLVGLPNRSSIPVLVPCKVGAFKLLFLAAEIEAVGENLIHYAADRPLGRIKALFVAGELPAALGVILNFALFKRIARNEVAVSVGSRKPEAIPIQSHSVGGKVALPNLGGVVKFAAPNQLNIFPVVVKIIFDAELNNF